MISSHSDNRGLVIPPKLSEYKAVILPVYAKGNKAEVDDFSHKIGKILTQSDITVPVK